MDKVYGGRMRRNGWKNKPAYSNVEALWKHCDQPLVVSPKQSAAAPPFSVKVQMKLF